MNRADNSKQSSHRSDGFRGGLLTIHVSFLAYIINRECSDIRYGASVRRKLPVATLFRDTIILLNDTDFQLKPSELQERLFTFIV